MLRRSSLVNIVFIVTLVVALTTLLFTIFVYRSSKEIQLDTPAIYNVYHPFKTSSTTFRYYNGNTFVEYNRETNAARQLTSFDSMYDVSSAIWYKNGVVFNVSAISETSNLMSQYRTYTAQLAQSGFLSQDDIFNARLVYWHLNFETNELKPLGLYTDGFINTSHTSSDGLIFDNTDSYAALSPQGAVTPNLVPLFNTEEVKLLYATDEKVYYAAKEDGDISLRSYTIASNKDSLLISDIYNDGANHQIEEPLYMVDENSLYTLTSTGMTGGVGLSSVRKTTVTTNQSQTIISGKQGFFNRSSFDSLSYLHIGHESVELFTIGSSSIASHIIHDSKTLPASAFLLQDNLLYIDTNGRLYNLFTQRGKQVKGDKTALDDRYKSDNASLKRNLFSNNDNSYTLTVAKGSYTQERARLNEYIKGRGLNPVDYTIITVNGPLSTP